jgi:biotin carboxylase
VPRLLVLGAADLREDAFASWARSGLEVWLVDPNEQGRYDAQVARARRGGTWGESDPMAAAPDWVGAADGVTTLSDFSVIAAARAAAASGLPGPGVEAARRTRDKIAQRHAYAEAGLAGPRFVVVRSAADLAAFYADDPGVCVLKPADSAGSAGVHLVASQAEATAALPSALTWSFDRTCIIEQRLVGMEFSVEGWARDGEVTVAAVTRKTLMPGTFVEQQHLQPAETGPEIGALIEAAVRALGLETSTFHGEVMLTAHGPVMIELAARPGGGVIPAVLRASTGVDLYQVQAALALGAELPAPGQPEGKYAGVRFVVCRDRIRRDAGRDELSDLLASDGVLAVRQVQPAGTRADDLIGNDRRVGYVVAAADDRAALESRLSELVDELAKRMGCS